MRRSLDEGLVATSGFVGEVCLGSTVATRAEVRNVEVVAQGDVRNGVDGFRQRKKSGGLGQTIVRKRRDAVWREDIPNGGAVAEEDV
jgi:hypothetical protein